MEEDDLFMRLPDDIWMDIASRLRVKDACRFQCLSKSWLTLISSNSEFRKLHRRRARRRPSFLALTGLISHVDNPEQVFTSYDLFIEDNLSPEELSVKGSSRTSKVVFNFVEQSSHNYILNFNFSESCRDLVCFYNNRVIYVYVPSIGRYLHLNFTNSSGFGNYITERNNFKVGIVYVASRNLYKIVKMQMMHNGIHFWKRPSADKTIVKFEALTIHEEEDDGGRNSYKEEEQTPWELTSEHTMSTRVHQTGNLIGVNSVVYSLVVICEPVVEYKVLSLDLEEENKIMLFSLPQEISPYKSFRAVSNTLSQIKDVLCFPYVPEKERIDLWLLEDRNTSHWIKAYTIDFIPPSTTDYWYGPVGQVVYFPCPQTTIDDDDDDDEPSTSKDVDNGIILFSFGIPRGVLYQYDIHTKGVAKQLPVQTDKRIYVFADNLVWLKNSLRCKNIPLGWRPPQPQKSNPRNWKIPHPPPPQLPFPPPPPPACYPHDIQSPELRMRISRPPPIQLSLPVPLRWRPPPPPKIQPPQPQQSSPNKRKNPHAPPPQLPFPSPPQQVCYPHNIQSPELRTRLSRPPPIQLYLPPLAPLPPSAYYPRNLQLDIDSPDHLKRRKLDSSVLIAPIPPAQPPYHPCTMEKEIGFQPQQLQYCPSNSHHGMYIIHQRSREEVSVSSTVKEEMIHFLAEENKGSNTCSRSKRT